MIIDAIVHVVNSEAAGSLCLSKGGWEGWLQCELWRHLNLDREIAAEREVAFPGSRDRCDLVVPNSGGSTWVELKAYGVFRDGDEDRFLDGVAHDVFKLDSKPSGTDGLAVVVVPKSIGASFEQAIKARGMIGFSKTDAKYAHIYTLAL